MARCSNCGYDQVRDGANFCPVCRAVQSPPQPQAIQAPNVPHGSIQQAPPFTPAPVPPTSVAPVSNQGRVIPSGQGAAGPIFALKPWKKPPQAEGVVHFMDGPHQHNRRDLPVRAAAGAMLGVFVAPVLVFLPFLGGTKVDVRFVRVHDTQTGHEMEIRLVGDLTSTIQLGDTVAIWAKSDRGTWDMVAAYNYNTDSEIRLRR